MSIQMNVVDLFAGPGGWDEGIRLAYPDANVVGIEWDEAACNTARKAGHYRIGPGEAGDVAKLNPAIFTTANYLHASPPCFIAGTPVLTRRGSAPIEDIKVGDEVWTHRGRWRKVTATMTRESDVVRVGPITATPDHPFYARTFGRVWGNEARQYRRTLDDPAWVRAENLQGHFLASPVAVTGDGTAWLCDPWLAGRYVADGWTGRDGLMVAIGAGKESEFEANNGLTGWRVSTSGKSCSRYTLSDHGLASWLSDTFGRGVVRSIRHRSIQLLEAIMLKFEIFKRREG